MTSLPLTNYRLDWQQFCAAQPADLAAQFEALLAATQGSDDAADQCLAEVVGQAATDGAMARLVLQRVMPGLLSVAKRRSHIEPGGFGEILHDLVANAWIAVRLYPLDRRPRKIAANLVRDIEYTTFVQDRRLRRVPIAEMPKQLGERPAVHSTNAGEEVIATLAAARRSGLRREHPYDPHSPPRRRTRPRPPRRLRRPPQSDRSASACRITDDARGVAST
jgi:hypothetical protein